MIWGSPKPIALFAKSAFSVRCEILAGACKSVGGWGWGGSRARRRRCLNCCSKLLVRNLVWERLAGSFHACLVAVSQTDGLCRE